MTRPRIDWPAELTRALADGECAADVARRLGVSRAAACKAQRRTGIRLADARAERMRRLNADPEFVKARDERAAEHMRRLNADPARNPLAALTPAERADYDTLRRKGGYTRSDALRAIGRSDLVGATA